MPVAHQFKSPSMTKFQWILLHYWRSKLWIRASLFCIAAVISALIAAWIGDFVPDDIPQKVGSDSVDSILQILASSMLAVTIFSLNTIVSAFAAASSSTTPRATQLLLQDRRAQNALSTFLGSFLFSLVGIVLLHMHIYGDRGRLVLFVVTVGVIVVIVITLLRWINYLSTLGRVSTTIDMIEKATTKAISERLHSPYLGGLKWQSEPDSSLHAYHCDKIGYLQHIDMRKLQRLAEQHALEIFLPLTPGAFNGTNHPLFYTSQAIERDVSHDIREAFTIDDKRSFEQDPRYGLVVLSEIASRALSPAVNDPGTAIDVIGTCLRVIAPWIQSDHAQPEPVFPSIHVRPICIADMLDDALLGLARDGSSMLEVQLRLQKCLLSFWDMADAGTRHEIKRISDISLEYMEIDMKLMRHKQLLKQFASQFNHAETVI